MNIVLIGYRGTGKSEVAAILSGSLAMEKIGTDQEIVMKTGLSIPEIVSRYGWEKFRDLESQIASEVSKLDHRIIDTGGGIIERPENMAALKKKGAIFWLKASVPVIIKRIQSTTDRPALTPGQTFVDEVSKVLNNRIPRYQAAARYEINTDERTPQEVAEEVVRLWGKDWEVEGRG